MNKKWMPKVTEILDIICGVYSIVIGYYAFLLKPSFQIAVIELYGHLNWYFTWLASLILVFIAGVLLIVGGVFAFQRKKWHLALAGAIASSVALSLLAVSIYYNVLHHPALALIVLPGIAAIVLTVLSKKEFK